MHDRAARTMKRHMQEPQQHTRDRTPPAKRWRNYYRVYRVIDLGGGYWFPGLHPGPSVFPSQDLAESHAQAILALLNSPRRTLMEHAGAFPEGDRAN